MVGLEKLEVGRLVKKFLAPLDGTEFSEAALPIADKLARHAGGEHVLVRVGELPETSMQAAVQKQELTPGLSEAAERVSSPSNHRVQPAGDPVRGILEKAKDEQVDMIMMSTHGRSGLEELAAGSTALGLIRARWTARVTLPGRKRKDFFGRTRQQVAEKLAVALKSRQDGLPVINERTTVGQFLDTWLESIQATVRPETYVTYESLLRLHVRPCIGRLTLSRLAPPHLQKLYGDRLAVGLSPQSVHHIHAVLHRALEHAVRWNLVVRKVADLVSPPRVVHHEMRTLDLPHVKRLLEAATDDRLEAFYVLAITTGMRLGELLALAGRMWSEPESRSTSAGL